MKYFSFQRRFCSSPKKFYNLLFFGADGVSLVGLQKLNELKSKNETVSNLSLVTANKSKKRTQIEKYAETHNINLLKWPLKVDCRHNYDLGIVVSFGHIIPRDVIESFPLGMINVHTSLLPRWRGAAPVVHALLNGDTVTGITLMKIEPNRFDIGDIISQKECNITNEILLPDLTIQLAELGADELIKCVQFLPDSLLNRRHQPNDGVTYAKKIKSDISIIKWNNMTARQVFNLYRAIYGVYTLRTSFMNSEIKLFNAFIESVDNVNIVNTEFKPGKILYSKRLQAIKVLCKDNNYINFKSVRIVGRKEISATDFYNGYLKKYSEDQHYFY